MSSTSEVVDRAFANETVGLQTREQYAEKARPPRTSPRPQRGSSVCAQPARDGACGHPARAPAQRANIEKEVAQERELRRLAAEERELRQLQKRRSQKARRATLRAGLSRSCAPGATRDARRGAQRVDTAKLSFGDEAEEEEEEEEATGADGGAKKLKFSTCSKDPTVPTDFLPDRDREREARPARRAGAGRQAEQANASLAARPCDAGACGAGAAEGGVARGAGAPQGGAARRHLLLLGRDGPPAHDHGARHRAAPLSLSLSHTHCPTGRVPRPAPRAQVKKGDTIGQFLRAVRDQCMGDFRELRARARAGGAPCSHGGHSERSARARASAERLR